MDDSDSFKSRMAVCGLDSLAEDRDQW